MFLFCALLFRFFFFSGTSPTEIYTLSLHDALPISRPVRLIESKCWNRLFDNGECPGSPHADPSGYRWHAQRRRSEEHTSELQSPCNLVCRLLLEKKKLQLRPHQWRVFCNRCYIASL